MIWNCTQQHNGGNNKNCTKYPTKKHETNTIVWKYGESEWDKIQAYDFRVQLWIPLVLQCEKTFINFKKTARLGTGICVLLHSNSGQNCTYEHRAVNANAIMKKQLEKTERKYGSRDERWKKKTSCCYWQCIMLFLLMKYFPFSLLDIQNVLKRKKSDKEQFLCSANLLWS